MFDPSHSATQINRLKSTDDMNDENTRPSDNNGSTSSINANEREFRRGRGRNNCSGAGALRLIRRPLKSMKNEQYQLVAVTGLITSEEQYQVGIKLRILINIIKFNNFYTRNEGVVGVYHRRRWYCAFITAGTREWRV